jgi:uncharacterized membrane protein
MTEESGQLSTTAGTAKLIYILYLISLVFPPTAFIGVIIAYIKKADAPEWLESHYKYQFNTFMLSIFIILLGYFLIAVGIGYIIWLAWIIWLLIRVFTGLKHLNAGKSAP